MKKFLAIWLMFFGTATMAENITLVCTPNMNQPYDDVYLRFNDEEQTIRYSYKNDFTHVDDEIVVHWSDKMIVFASTPLPCCLPSTTWLNESLSALDRVKGRLQVVYVSDRNFDQNYGELYLYECELHDRENPKF